MTKPGERGIIKGKIEVHVTRVGAVGYPSQGVAVLKGERAEGPLGEGASGKGNNILFTVALAECYPRSGCALLAFSARMMPTAGVGFLFLLMRVARLWLKKLSTPRINVVDIYVGAGL